ncbi:MAG: ABC transporter permease [Betaproteobacteria bacterium]
MSAARDIVDSWNRWGVWLRLGFSDTASKYRRSILGPLWLTLGMGITVAGLGTFWSLIWKTDIASFFPYLTAGLLLWGFIVGALVEGCVCFAQQASVIRAAPLPLFIHPLRLAVKLLITFSHNVLVFVAVAIIFKVPVGSGMVLVVPGMVLLFAFAVGAALTLGIVGARFRDFPPIVEAVVPLLFFITPVLWFRSALGAQAHFADFNPFTHLIAVVREPMLGHVPTALNYAVACGLVVVVWLVGLPLFARARTRLSLWI